MTLLAFGSGVSLAHLWQDPCSWTNSRAPELNLRLRPGTDRQYYRAQPVFQPLYVCLKANGIKSRCLRTLRKEIGSAINVYFGLLCGHDRDRSAKELPRPKAVAGI